MKRFMVKVRWSQTDSDNYIVHAETGLKAIEKAKARMPNARYFESYDEIRGEIE